MLNKNHLKFIIALLVIFAVGYVCSSNKDDKKEDSKKEDTKKEDIKKEDTKKEDTKREETTSGAKLYFCEEYDEREIARSETFTIGSNGGYFCCMIDLRPAGKTIGVGKLDLRITKKTSDGEKIIDTKNFDVQPDWDYISFNKFYTFYSSGLYKVTALKPDGTPVASGEVTIKMR